MTAAGEGVQLDPRSIADLNRLAAAYKGGDKVLQKRLRTGLQVAARPLAAAVVREGSASLPRAGGLRARIAASRSGVTASLGGRVVAVSIRAADRQKDSLTGLDQGTIRHPVFGNRSVWVSQQVPAHRFSEAFHANAPATRAMVNAEIAKGLDEIARKA